MATKKYILTENHELTEKQLKMLERAADLPVVYDEDNPELTEEQLAEFRRVHEGRQNDRRRQNVTLRLTPQTITKAKSLGKGYSGILSRIVEGVLNDPEQLKKYL